MSSATLKILSNPEVIAVNQDKLGVQGKKVALLPSKLINVTADVIVANYSSSFVSDAEPTRFQWTYNAQDSSIRSKHNNYCLTIVDCNTAEAANIIIAPCEINHPQAKCQGKNQQWTYNTADQRIVSKLDGKW